jgi:hypothetical protein
MSGMVSAQKLCSSSRDTAFSLRVLLPKRNPLWQFPKRSPQW